MLQVQQSTVVHQEPNQLNSTTDEIDYNCALTTYGPSSLDIHLNYWNCTSSEQNLLCQLWLYCFVC